MSEVTSDYASNVSNQFKVKPNLRLHREGWKVSIASAILPKMSLFKDLQSADVNLMELWAETEKANQSGVSQKGYILSKRLTPRFPLFNLFSK